MCAAAVVDDMISAASTTAPPISKVKDKSLSPGGGKKCRPVRETRVDAEALEMAVMG